MRDYLINLGVIEDDIFMDHAGFSTYDSIYRFRDVFLGKKVIIVTQEYHLYRALYIASKLGIDAYGVRADDINSQAIMKKNEYMKPAMRVVALKQRPHLLAGSGGSVQSVSNSDGLSWDSDGVDGDDY